MFNIAVMHYVPLDSMDIAVKSHASTHNLAFVVKGCVIADGGCAII